MQWNFEIFNKYHGLFIGPIGTLKDTVNDPRVEP